MKIILFIGLFILSVTAAQAQESKKKSKKELKAEKKAQQIVETKALVESKSFIFAATNVNPMKGRSINLTSEYDVKIANDSIFSYLPYYGRAYTANYGGTESPMTFDSPADAYTMEETNKGYRVKVSAKNGNDRIDFTFHIFETGSTTLNVSSINRQAISYYGNLEKIKTKEEKKK